MNSKNGETSLDEVVTSQEKIIKRDEIFDILHTREVLCMSVNP
jgi:hypothetical protein